MSDLGTELVWLWDQCQGYGWTMYITNLGQGKITVTCPWFDVTYDLQGQELSGRALRRVWYMALKRHEEKGGAV